MEFIKVASGAEYSLDFDFFTENQIVVCNSFHGTIIYSRIEEKAFYKNKDRNPSSEFIQHRLNEIHNKIITKKI